MYDLNGKVALVTGAGGEGGIGRAIAVRLAQEGTDLVINDIATPNHGRGQSRWKGVPDVVREIEALGRQALGILADVGDAAEVDRMVSQAVQRFGHIDILVNNASAPPGRDRVPVVDLEEEAWDTVQRVNVKGTFFCSRGVAREMIRRGRSGKIIIISSTRGKRGAARFAAYAASKFALIGFAQSLALELAPHHINVNVICPGIVNTERLGHMAAALAGEGESPQEYQAQMLRQRALEIPLGRLGETSDIARIAAFLASSESDYLTGLSINVTGGTHMN